MAQALVRALAAQKTEYHGSIQPLFGGVWAIFGHGNVAGMGEALYGARHQISTFRAHNEQAMAHAAIAFAKASRRRRMMAATTSIGPGATNMVTAAALAHANRLPILLLPGDVFANRRPDPVLQQVEKFDDGTISANDCFRPVSRYFDRIMRPEQIVPALERALSVFNDAAECGPVTLALCQDVQAEAYDYPVSFFEERLWLPRRLGPDAHELARAIEWLMDSQKPLIIAGGGVLYSEAEKELIRFAEMLGIPVCETQAGKSAMPDDHDLAMGSIGVTGTAAANALAAEADLIIAVGTRLQDFTTGSWTLFAHPDRRLLALNVQPFDAMKHRAAPLVCDARVGLDLLTECMQGRHAPSDWTGRAKREKMAWNLEASYYTQPRNSGLPSDAEVIGAVQRQAQSTDIVVCAAGGLPGELHKLWRAGSPGGYHVEYGYSCMGYEIAGGLGVKMAEPDREVFVMVGDGSYLMMNSEIATSVMLGVKLTIVLLDNRGFGCINRLQNATGSASFNNLLKDTRHQTLPDIDFSAHAKSLGALSFHVHSLAELETALQNTRATTQTTVLVIDTDPLRTTDAGGHWWDVAVPEVSQHGSVNEARETYEKKLKSQFFGD
jgi:3D-(3,5/4)-trihydroxycyclohexane-1,2-dione acylhydrolase (decyclizing)